MCRFHETGEFGGGKKRDVARSPPPNNHGFLLVHHLVEHASQIFTEPGVRCFTRHEAPDWYCTAFLYGDGGHAFVHTSGLCEPQNLLPRADLRLLILRQRPAACLAANRALRDAKFGRASPSRLYDDLHIVAQGNQETH